MAINSFEGFLRRGVLRREDLRYMELPTLANPLGVTGAVTSCTIGAPGRFADVR